MEFPKFSLLTSQSSDTIPSLNFLKIISILSLYILKGYSFSTTFDYENDLDTKK